ncbi:MAG: hypothetical protein AAF800_03850 [Planctomycetota bacterium]
MKMWTGAVLVLAALWVGGCEEAENAAESVGEATQEAAEKTGNTVSDAVDSVKQQASEAGQKVEEAAGEALRSGEETVEQVVETTKQKVDEAVTAGEQKLDELTGAAESAGEETAGEVDASSLSLSDLTAGMKLDAGTADAAIAKVKSLIGEENYDLAAQWIGKLESVELPAGYGAQLDQIKGMLEQAKSLGGALQGLGK